METGLDYRGARFYDSDVCRFLSLDPLAAEFPEWSDYNYVLGNPMMFVDPDGKAPQADIYNLNGKLIGSDGKDDDRILVSSTKNNTKLSKGEATYLIQIHDFLFERGKLKHGVGLTDLHVSSEELIAFASTVHQESSGNKKESMAIANVTMNFLGEGGSKSLKTLEDVVLYKNSFARGATQKHYDKFKSLPHKNSKHAMEAVINALGYDAGVSGTKDYSNGADSWDGVDLVSTHWKNPHRKYTWNATSKTMLETYRKKVNGGVQTNNFKYKKSGYQIEATTIIGRTIYTNLQTGRGEGKTSNIRFN